MTVARITVQPAGLSFFAEIGEPIMMAATRQGLRWPTSCHGQGECGLCAALVIEGEEHLTPISPAETATLAAAGRKAKACGPQWRLACQAHACGDVMLEKRGVRPVG